MLMQKVRKVGNSYVVTVPQEEMERQGIHEGDVIGVEFRALSIAPKLTPDIEASWQRVFENNRATFDFLRDK